MKKRHFVHAICILGLTIATSGRANNINVAHEKNMLGCYDTVIFNNSNATSRGGRVDWRYDYADGSYNSGTTYTSGIGPGQRANLPTYDGTDVAKCKKISYQFKVLN